MTINKIVSFWNTKHTLYFQKNLITCPTPFSNKVMSFLTKGSYILELGCGQGHDAAYFAQNSCHVLATDISPTVIKLAKAKQAKLLNNINFEELDMSQPFPYDDKTFDTVYAHKSLQYFDVEKTQAILSEIKRVLKPGGILAVVVNTINDPEINSSTHIKDQLYIGADGIPKSYFTVDLLKTITQQFKTILLDSQGSTYIDSHQNLIRYVGKK